MYLGEPIRHSFNSPLRHLPYEVWPNGQHRMVFKFLYQDSMQKWLHGGTACQERLLSPMGPENQMDTFAPMHPMERAHIHKPCANLSCSWLHHNAVCSAPMMPGKHGGAHCHAICLQPCL